MNTEYNKCPNCGREKDAKARLCISCRMVYLDGYDEGFHDGLEAGERAFKSTIAMVFGPAKENEP